jgi:hypothetical protein
MREQSLSNRSATTVPGHARKDVAGEQASGGAVRLWRHLCRSIGAITSHLSWTTPAWRADETGFEGQRRVAEGGVTVTLERRNSMSASSPRIEQLVSDRPWTAAQVVKL